MRHLPRTLGVLIGTGAAMFSFALLLFGAWSPLELMASGAIGLVGGIAGAATDRVASPRYAFRLRWLRSVVSVPTRVVVDFGILTRELVLALATGKPRTGTFRAKPFDPGDTGGALGAGRRAFVGAVAGYSPNAYVVEIDPERRQVLVHDLVPNERSEAPA